MKQFKITHFLSFLFLFVLLATTLSSCKSASVVPPATIETINTVTVKEVIRDTIFETQKDSSYYKAWLQCKDGKVILTPNPFPKESRAAAKAGKYLKIPKVIVQDNILTVDCEAEAQKLFYEWKDVYRENMKSVLQKIPYPVEKPLSWWQKTEIILGRLFLALIVICAALGVLRYFKRI